MNNRAQQDFFDAFARMTDHEKLLLEVFANRYIGGTPYTSATDIIHEVIVKVLEGKRHWPADVDLAMFIASSVRSIASNSRKRSEMLNLSLDALGEEDACGARPRYEPAPSAEDVALLNERKAITHKAAKFAKATLRNDEQGLQVLEGMMAGLEPKDMCAAFGLAPDAFKAARQRVANRLRIYGQRNPL
jgi:DNA-directed RNA polymerase specialized sigma24 family protein